MRNWFLSFVCLLTMSSLAAERVLVLTDGCQSEYWFGTDDEKGYRPRDPINEFHAAGILNWRHRFEKYLRGSRLEVRSLDLEAQRDLLTFGGTSLVVVDDVRSFVLAPHAARLCDYVGQGGSLLIVAGFYGLGGRKPETDLSVLSDVSDYRVLPLSRLLPVRITASPDYAHPAEPDKVMPKVDADDPLFAGLPVADWRVWGYHVVEPVAGAAVHGTIAGAPLVAEREVGKGHVVVYNAAELEWVHHGGGPWVYDEAFIRRLVAFAAGKALDRVSLEVRAGPSSTLHVEVSGRPARAEQFTLANDMDRRSCPVGRLEPSKAGHASFDLHTAGLVPGKYRLLLEWRDILGIRQASASEFELKPLSEVGLTLDLSDAWKRGRTARGCVKLRANRDLDSTNLELEIARHQGQSLLHLTRDLGRVRPGEYAQPFAVDTSRLGRGSYDCIVKLYESDHFLTAAAQSFWVAEYDRYFQNMLWWAGGDYADPRMHQLVVEDLARHHVGMGGPEPHRYGYWQLEQIGFQGNAANYPMLKGRSEAHAVDAEGRLMSSFCVNNDRLYEAAADYFAERLRKQFPDPSIAFVNLEDESGIPWCYCKTCRRLFREQYGYEMPTPKDDSSAQFLKQWSDRVEFHLWSRENYHRRAREVVQSTLGKEARVLASLPQGFTSYLGEDALHNHRPLDAAWEHSYPGSEPLLAALPPARIEAALRLTDQPDRPILQLLQGFAAEGPFPRMPKREYTREIAWAGVSHGTDHIGWFIYYWMRWSMPGTGAWEGVQEMGDILHELGPTLAKLKPERYPIGLLYPRSSEEADILRYFVTTTKEEPQHDVILWRIWHSYEAAFLALKLGHIPADCVFEDELWREVSLPYRAIVIPTGDYLRPETTTALAKFMQAGGKVFVGSTYRFDLPGTVQLPTDFETLFHLYFPRESREEWGKRRIRSCYIEEIQRKARLLAETLAPFHDNAVSLDAAEVAWNTRLGGEATYLFLINDTARQEVTPELLDRRGKYNHFAIMPTEYLPVETVINVAHQGVIYDVLNHTAVKGRRAGKRQSFPAALRGGEGRLYALLPSALQGVRVDAPAEVERGRSLTLEVAVESKGRPVSAVVPIEITLVEGSYAKTIYEATTDGKLNLEMPTDFDLPVGVATLRVRELLSGKSTTERIRVLAGKGPAKWEEQDQFHPGL